MGDSSSPYDVVILGGGSGGYACSLRAAQLGMRVALVERERLGGTCLHNGCIPAKALLQAAAVADSARKSAQFGVVAPFVSVDMEGVNKYKDGVVNDLYKGLQGLVKSRGITYVEGTGRLVTANAVEVDGERYEGRHVVLATGSHALSPPGIDIDGERVINSDHALNLDYVPRSVIVLGGGVIGVEFASAWTSFGAEVTIVEALPRLVPTEDDACSKALGRAFRRRGITSKTGVRVSAVERTEQGVSVSLESGDSIAADLLLVAVGRGPNTSGMGYEERGLRMERGFVITDERLRTNVPSVYAAGDIVPGLQLAHRGFQHGIFIAEEIGGLEPNSIDELGIPRVTYCEPEVASLGMTEAQARQRFGVDGLEIMQYDLGGNGKSQILKTRGFIKLVREKDGPVVGVHMVGDRIGELIGEAQLIYNWKALPAEIAQFVHAHPTQSEALGEAHLALAGKPLHAHS